MNKNDIYKQLNKMIICRKIKEREQNLIMQIFRPLLKQNNLVLKYTTCHMKLLQ